MSDNVPTPYEERNRNPVNRWVNQRLDRITQDEIGKYIQRYATHSDGTRDEALAARIRYEVTRRSQMGREIDVLEPARWTAYSSILSVFSGTAAKVLHDKPANNRVALRSALIGTAIASFFGAIVTGGRIFSFARFKSGLYAGAQTAIKLNDTALPDPQSEYIQQPGWQKRIEQERTEENTISRT